MSRAGDRGLEQTFAGSPPPRRDHVPSSRSRPPQLSPLWNAGAAAAAYSAAPPETAATPPRRCHREQPPSPPFLAAANKKNRYRITGIGFLFNTPEGVLVDYLPK